MKHPQAPPAPSELLGKLLQATDPQTRLQAFARSGPVDDHGRYLHWDEMRWRKPPPGMSHEEWWLGTWMSRSALRRDLPLSAIDGSPFGICMVDPVWESLHRIDQAAAGDLLADDPSVAADNRTRYVVGSLIEEAVASSQLEGATTTRRDAKRMLLTGRAPADRSEQMILNNYEAINEVRRLAGTQQPLSEELVLELHRMITEETLDNPADAGRIQVSTEERVAVYWPDGSHNEQRVHEPPQAQELPERIAAMCAFANGESDAGFVHPIVRAIVLHFWLAYDHPFVDGNGRLARSLFYWSMLRSGYWMSEYLTVSSILRQAPAQYARSYLLTETDGNDLTYFVLHQLGVIEKSIDALRAYLRRKREEVREVEALLIGRSEYNHRQRDLLASALRDPNATFTIRGHQTAHGVTYQTARTDLLSLSDVGLLMKMRDGRSFRFIPEANFDAKVRRVDS